MYLTVPKEISLLPVRDGKFPTADQLGVPRPAAPDAEAIEELAEKLVGAKHPVVVVSGSGRNPDTLPELVKLCEMLGAAGRRTRSSKAYLSFPYDHPLFQATDGAERGRCRAGAGSRCAVGAGAQFAAR